MAAKKQTKQSFLTRLGKKLKSPKAKLLVVAVAFVVIGGGIMVYRSFAASEYYTYCAPEPTNMDQYEGNVCREPASLTKGQPPVNELKKKPGNILNPKVRTTYKNEAAGINIAMPGGGNQKIRYCVTMKPIYGSGVKFYTQNNDWNRTQLKSNGLVVPQSGSFGRYCSNWISSPTAIAHSTVVMELTSGYVEVSTISIETSAPAPSPGK